MFSRKRRFYEKKTFYAAVLTAFSLVLSFGLWFNGDIGSEPGTEILEEPQTDSKSDSDTAAENVASSKADVAVSGAEVVDRPLNEGYFVVEEDGYVRIYQVDKAGEKSLVRTSEILFDLLSSEDQEMFQMGVELQNEDQLMELLQDFES